MAAMARWFTPLGAWTWRTYSNESICWMGRGVQPDQPLRHAVDDGGKAATAVGLGVFRPADQPVVGGDLQKRKRAPAGVAMQVLELRDFHGRFPHELRTG